MKKTLIMCLALGTFFCSIAQETPPSLNSCSTDFINQKKLKADSNITSKMEEFEKLLKKQQLTSKKSSTIYTIPVVVHIMHKGESIGTSTNISDTDIQAKIKSINEDFRKVNKTTNNSVDIGIQFALAITDPSGNPTSGIVRFNMSNFPNYMNEGINVKNTTGMNDTDLKALSFWDSNLYYNIWIVSEIDNNNGGTGTQGYATFAGFHGNTSDGTVIIANSVKNLNSNTATHELGHAFNLFHTFEGDNNGNACPLNDPEAGDYCADTPAHKRSDIDCASLLNSCYPDINDYSFLNNYMSYSYDSCRNMFTADQKNRMTSTLSLIRNSFLSSNSTNKLKPTTTPIANFSPVEPFLISAGTDLNLYDTSIGVPNVYLQENSWPNMAFDWTVASNATSLTSTNQNPKFTLNDAGVYSISHSVNNGLGKSSKTATNLIYVFKPVNTLPANTISSQYNGNYAYTIYNVKFKNIDIRTNTNLNTPYSDLSNTNNALVSSGKTYPLSITLRAGNQYSEYAVVYIDYNNNGTFEEVEKIGSNNINSSTSSIFTIDVTIPEYAVKNTLLRMRISGNGRNEITNNMINGKASYFVSDTKDFGIYIIDTNKTLNNPDFKNLDISYYPNPVNNLLNINYTEKIEKIDIYNLTGQLLLSKNCDDTKIAVDLSRLQSGTYIASIHSENKINSVKILKN